MNRKILQKRCAPDMLTDGSWGRRVPAELVVSGLGLALMWGEWVALVAVALTT